MKKIVCLMIWVFGGVGVFGALGMIKPQIVRAQIPNVKCAQPTTPKTCPPTGYDAYKTPCTEAEEGFLCCLNANECGKMPAVDQYVSTWFNQDVKNFAKNVFEPAETEINSDRYAKYSLDSIAMSIGIGAIGAPGQGTAQGPNNSAVAQLGSAIAYMTSQPAVSTGEYLAYMGNKAGFVEQVYAQGAGYRGLLPILPIWVAFRNIAYLITSLMLVVIGFMIMLRKKIDAQTVIGVQQALPRIVVTLLLITFSYAIAGLVIDMMYFLIYLMIGIVGTFGIYSNINALKDILFQHNAFTIGLSHLWWDPEGAVTAANAIGKLTDNILFGETIFGIGTILGQPIAYLIVSVAILFAVFKLFFSLLMAYIQIVLSVIIAPLQLIMGALPGSDAFSKWFRNLLANAAAFPTTAAMFILAAALLGLDKKWGVSPNIGYSTFTSHGEGFLPPFVGKGGDVDLFQAIIGLGIILLLPKVVDMVKEALKAPEFKYGSAIGEAVGFGWGGVKGTVGFGVSRGEGYYRGEQAERGRKAGFLAEERFRELAGGTDAAGNPKYTKQRYQPERGRVGRIVDVLRGR